MVDGLILTGKTVYDDVDFAYEALNMAIGSGSEARYNDAYNRVSANGDAWIGAGKGIITSACNTFNPEKASTLFDSNAKIADRVEYAESAVNTALLVKGGADFGSWMKGKAPKIQSVAESIGSLKNFSSKVSNVFKNSFNEAYSANPSMALAGDGYGGFGGGGNSFSPSVFFDSLNEGFGDALGGSKGVGEAVEGNYVLFNKTHAGSAPVPKGTGLNGGRLQSHHGLQQQWAKENLSQYGYDPDLAPTITIETGKGMPHTSLSNAQNARRNARVASGNGKWSSSLQDELGYMVDDFTNAGFSKGTINGVLEQQYKMLAKLKVPYERIDIK